MVLIGQKTLQSIAPIIIILTVLSLIYIDNPSKFTIIGGSDCYRGMSEYRSDGKIYVNFQDDGGSTGVMGESNVIIYCAHMQIINMPRDTCLLWGGSEIGAGLNKCALPQSIYAKLYIESLTGAATLQNTNPASQNMGLSIGSLTATLTKGIMNPDGSVSFTYIYAPTVTSQDAWNALWSRISGQYVLVRAIAPITPPVEPPVIPPITPPVEPPVIPPITPPIGINTFAFVMAIIVTGALVSVILIKMKK